MTLPIIARRPTREPEVEVPVGRLSRAVWTGRETHPAGTSFTSAHPRSLPMVALSALLITSAVMAQESVRDGRLAVPLDGDSFHARIAAVDRDWNVTFDAGEDRRVLPVQDLVHWGAYSDSYQGTQILLADGSLLMAEVLEIADERIVVYGELWGQTNLPLSQIRGVVFNPPVAPFGRDRLHDRILTANGALDRLLLENGDVVSGSVKGLREASDTDPNDSPAVSISTEGRDVEIPIDKTAAVVFNPALVETPKHRGLRVLMGFRDGSLAVVEQIGQGGVFVQLKLPGRVELKADSETIWTELTLLRPFGQRVTYLSDMKSIGYKHVPFLDTQWSFQADRNVLGGRLRSAGCVYAKGLGMHTTSRLAYDLAEDYRRFQADIALDERAGLGGSVVFRVFLADSTGKWNREPAYESPIVRGSAKPIPISVDVTGASRMALIVDFAERGDALDYANWLNARLIK